MTHVIGFYEGSDTATMLTLIRQQSKLLEMLSARLSDQIKVQAELRERIAKLEEQKPAVPYALTPQEDYRIPRYRCGCGACEAARGRGEKDW